MFCALALASAPAGPLPMFQAVESPGLERVGRAYGGSWFDLDGDGDLDFALNFHGTGIGVWRNDPGLALVPVDSSLHFPVDRLDRHGLAACDHDRDGQWEFYVSVGADRGQGEGNNELWDRRGTAPYGDVLPGETMLQDPQGRGRGGLWVNLDDDPWPELLGFNYDSPARYFDFDGETWRDRTLDSPPWIGSAARRSQAAGRGSWLGESAAADLDGDGDTDLLCTGHGYFLFENDGHGGLLDRAAASGLPLDGNIPADLALADVDRDGDADLLLVYATSRRPPELYRNESGPAGLRFVAAGTVQPGQPPHRYEGVTVADLDNDGRLDLLFWGQGPEWTGAAPQMMRGDGQGGFVDPPAAWGELDHVEALTTGVWAIDVDDDGDLDLLATAGRGDYPERRGNLVLYENRTRSAGVVLWLHDPSGPPHGMGARVELRTQRGGSSFAEMQATRQYFSSSFLPLHFGLGADPGPWEAVVTWSDGAVERFGLGRRAGPHRLTRGEGIASR